MGASDSKSFQPNSARSSRRRTKSLSGIDELDDIDVYLRTIDSDVRTFNGLREDERYTQYQKTLADYAQRLTTLRSSVKRTKQQKCDKLRRDIQNIVLALEDKVKNNEDNLDLATVESTSFINHSVAKRNNQVKNHAQTDRTSVISKTEDEKRKNDNKDKSEKIQERNKKIDELQQKFGSTETRTSKTKSANWQRDPRITTMNAIKDNAKKLEIDLQNAVTLQDNRLFTVLEKKVLILLTDLEMVNVDKYPELQERKEEISEMLIHINNKARKVKQTMPRSSESQHRDTIKSKKSVVAAGAKVEDMFKIADDVDILEMKANSLQGTKTSEEYKNVKQSATKHWAKLEEMSSADEAAYKYKQQIKERLKALIQILNERAEQNAKILQAELYELDVIKSEVDKMKSFVEEFNDGQKNDRYEFLDQNLRKLWANLTNIKETSDEVTASKKHIIEDIQSTLKILSEKVSSKGTEPIYAEILHKNKKTPDVVGEIKQLTSLLTRKSQYLSNPDLTSNEKDELANTLEYLGQEVKKHLEALKQSSKNDGMNKRISKTENKNENKITSNRDSINDAIILRNTTTTNVNGTKSISNTSKINTAQIIQNRISTSSSTTALNKNGNLRKEQNNINAKYQLIKSDVNVSLSDEKSAINMIVNHIPSNITGEEFDIIKNCNNVIDRSSKISMDEIMRIDASVQKLKKQIENFTGIKRDKEYSDIEDALMESVITLNVVDTLGLPNLKTAKDEVMHQIRELQAELPKKMAENEKKLNTSSNSTTELKTLEDMAQTLKKKVDCFSGMYKSVQYVQIEESLKTCLNKLSDLDCNDNERNKATRDQTRQKVEQYLKILDEKSLKAERPPSNRISVSYGKLETLRADLVKVKADIEGFQGKYKDDGYEKILLNLKKAKQDVENIEDLGSESMRTSIQQYKDYINQLATYFEEKLELL